jgi:hypothetical protein
MQEDLGAQELSVLDIHDAPSTESTKQIASETEFPKKSILHYSAVGIIASEVVALENPLDGLAGETNKAQEN